MHFCGLTKKTPSKASQPHPQGVVIAQACKVVIMEGEKEKVKHCGGCHCGAVRFEVWATRELDVYDCK